MIRDEKIIAFIEANCQIPESIQVGQSIKLMQPQDQFVLDVYRSLCSTNHAHLSTTRKNDKFAPIASVILGYVLGPEAKHFSHPRLQGSLVDLLKLGLLSRLIP